MIISPPIWSPISPPNGLTLLYLQVIDKQIHFLTNLQNQIEVSPPPLLFLGVVHRQDPTRRTWCTVEIRQGERGAPSRSNGKSVVHRQDPTRRAWCTVEIRRGERGAPLEGVHASPAKVVKVEHVNTLLVRYEYFIC